MPCTESQTDNFCNLCRFHMVQSLQTVDDVGFGYGDGFGYWTLFWPGVPVTDQAFTSREGERTVFIDAFSKIYRLEMCRLKYLECQPSVENDGAWCR